MMLYIDWENREVLSERTISERINNEIDELVTDRDFVNDTVTDIGYDAFDLLKLSENEKNECIQLLEKNAKEYAEATIMEDVEEYDTDCIY